MMLNDVVKINLSRNGYVPDYPPHLISRSEMKAGALAWIADMYPAPPNGYLAAEYNALISNVTDALSDFVNAEDETELPDWIYAYLLGTVVGPNSDTTDRHNVLVLMGLDNVDDEFTLPVYKRCYEVSTQWLAKYGIVERMPTMFAEPHVIKYFRLVATV